MLELMMIVCLVAGMLLNVISLMYLVRYYDFFRQLRMPSVVAAILAGILYIGTLLVAFYVCAEVTQIPAFSQEKLGKVVSSPLILSVLFVVQTVPAVLIYGISKKTNRK